MQLADSLSAAGGWTLKERLSLMGLRVGFLEAYARELYRERSTTLPHLRVAAEVCSGNTNPVRSSAKSLLQVSCTSIRYSQYVLKRSSSVVSCSSAETQE